MAIDSKKPVGKQVRDLVLVLFIGMAGALLIAFASLYYFGPTGAYKVGNVLLSPQVSQSLSYTDINEKSGKQARFLFDHVQLLYFSKAKKEWIRTEVNLRDYKKFYESISDERSLIVVPEQIVSFFNREQLATLTLLVKREEKSSENENTLSFQEVQFLPNGNYYRIQIHDAQNGRNWAYYYHENIFEESLKLLLEKDE